MVPANSLSVSDAGLLEGNSGTADMVFTVTRTGDLSATLTVNYATADGTALAGIDYAPTSGTVTFAVGVATTEVRVPIIGDLLDESDETFTLSLTGPITGSGAPFALAPRQTFATRVAPHGITTADLNADGKPDLIVANRDSDRVSVHLNTTPTGSSTVTLATRLDILTGSEPHSVAAGDINGDGKPDLAVGNRTSGTVTVLLNTTPAGAATASFAVGVNFNTHWPWSVVIGDVNADGKPDLVLASEQSSRVSVFLNTTPTGGTLPTFAPYQDFSVPAGPRRVLLSDVNGDGKPDIVTASKGLGGVVAVLLNDTTAGSSSVTLAPLQTLGVVNQPDDMMVGDLNGDGRPDFITSGSGPNAISVLLNTTPAGGTTVTAATRQDFAAGVTPTGVVIADMDGDGRPDVIVANRNTVSSAVPADNTISLFRNETPTGATQVTFALRQDVPAGRGEHGVVAADMNGDGVLDIAVTDRYDDTLSVFLQAEFTIVDGVGVGTIIDNDQPGQDLVARSAVSGAWVVLHSTGAAFDSRTFGGWNPTAGWRDVMSGDFNGDGKADIAGRTSDGHWWVGLSNGSAFVTTHWAGWNEAAGWKDVSVGDFNGDGKADVAGRTSDGHWWVGLSRGSAFVTTHWAGWNETAGWKDVSVGDFNGDGKADVAGRTSDGHWWVGSSTGNAFVSTHWGVFPVGGPYVDVRGGYFSA